MEGITLKDVKGFVYEWNVNNPVDKWWRSKHSIPFGSKDHRDACFVDMLIEYIEDNVYVEAYKDSKNRDVYVPGSGSILSEETGKLSENEVEELYDNIDLDNIVEPD